MTKRRDHASLRLLASLTVASVISLTACERDGGQPGAGTASDSFALPDVDVSSLPDGLQPRIRALRESVRQSPKNPDQVAGLGAIYYVQGFPGAAEKCFVRARELAPQSVDWWYYSALAHERLGRREEAIKAYEGALELDAGYPPFYVRLAQLLVETDAERAASLSQRALELAPNDPTAIFTLGLCAEAKGDLTTARSRFEEALHSIPNYREAHQALARVLNALELPEEAESHRQAAQVGRTPLRDDPVFETLLRSGYNYDILIRDSLLLAQRGLFEQADRALAMLADAERSGVVTHRTTGEVRAIQGRLEEAAERFRLVLQERPDAWDVRVELADVLARQSKYAEAEGEFRAALEQSSDARLALEPYCNLLVQLERPQEAEQLLRSALERRPDEAWIRFQLGRVLFEQNRDEEAREQLRACLEIEPGHAGACFALGLLAQRAGDLNGAKEKWNQILETTPNYLDAYAALAEVAIQERDYATAERYLRGGLQQVPNYPGLANGLAWILATSPDANQRNGKEAVELAQRACELTQNQRHEFLDTLAAAYAEVERFDDAVKTEEQAVRLAEEANHEDLADYRQRLALYRENQPYRENP